MNLLLNKYQDYMRLNGCRASYELADGTVIMVPYLEENFLHLIGLHKLTDIQLIQFWRDPGNPTVKLSDVIRVIKNETLTDANITASTHFSSICDRYNNFSYESLTKLSHTDAVINFNSALAHSRLNSDYLLFESKGSGYNHLGIAYDGVNGRRYFESFFYEHSNQYVAGQIIVPIKKFTLLDNSNNIIIEDSFP